MASNNYLKIPPEKIVSYIKSNFDYKTRKDGEEYLINSPFRDDTGYHFNINPEKGTCHDWRGDEWAGPVNPETNKRNCSFVKFVRLYKKCSYSAAISEIIGSRIDLKSYLRPDNRVTEDVAKNKYAVRLPEGTQPLLLSDDIQAKALIKWLISRGYTTESIEKFDLHHLGMEVYWPYYEFDTLVYWQSRSRMNKTFKFPPVEIKDEKNKTIGITDGSKKDFLYGFDEIEPASYLIITEAIFDQHSLGDQALASGGAVLTSVQIKKIKLLGPKKGVILSPDNDKAGIDSIISNSNILKSFGFDVYYSIPPKYKYTKNGDVFHTKDWNEIGKYVHGFDEVRKIHDKNIRKLDENSLVELSMLND